MSASEPSGVHPRLRVLHLGRFFDEGSFGGVQRIASSLVEGLAREIDVDNLVAANGLRGDCLSFPGYRVFRAPSCGIVAGTAMAPAMAFWARRLNAAHPYDIVHLHFPDPLSQLVAQCLPRRVRRVVSWHSDIVRQKFLLRLYQPLLDRFLRDVDAVCAATASHFASSTQLQAVPESRRHVIPYGLDYARFDAPGAKAQAGALRSAIGMNVPLVFAIGRHVYYKGFEYLIAAMKELPGFHLALGGSGPLTPRLREIARSAGVEERISFLGRLSDDELAAWYHACDVFCLPSTEVSEAFGLVQLEAMACGKPVVCTRLGTGVNEVTLEGETGLAVAPRDAGALAKALATLLGNVELRRRLGEAGSRRARETFSVEAMVEATLTLYRELARRAP